MTGNLIELTIGDWCKNQPGILESFTYDIPQEASWELKIGAGQNVGGELPMMIKVTGFKFFPIYDFRPDYRTKKLFANSIPISNPYTPSGNQSNTNRGGNTSNIASTSNTSNTSNWYSNVEQNVSSAQRNYDQNYAQNIESLKQMDAGLGLYNDGMGVNFNI